MNAARAANSQRQPGDASPGGRADAFGAPKSPPDPRLRELRLDAVAANRDQPRKRFDQGARERLADSIRERGVLQPVLVRQLAGEQFELIAGERRWRAAKLAALTAIGRRAASFGVQAAAYARGRPGYPAAALRFCLHEDARRSWIWGPARRELTDGLLALGLEVVAVEPSAEMRALIAPSADVRAGTAEAIPLEDTAVDAVLVGQAFHWFDRDAALAEIVRVLRPGGTVGLLWNRIRGGGAWIEEIARAMHEASRSVEAEAPWADRDDLTDPQWRTFTHGHETDGEGLLDSVRSRSAVILTDPAERERVLDRTGARARGALPPAA